MSNRGNTYSGGRYSNATTNNQYSTYNNRGYENESHDANSYHYQSYDQSRGSYENSAGPKRYSNSRQHYDTGNYYQKNVPPRHAKNYYHENTNNNSNNGNNRPKRPTKKQETEASPSVTPTEKRQPSVEAPATPSEIPVEPVICAIVEEIKPAEPMADETPVTSTSVAAPAPPEENLENIRQQVNSYIAERLDRWKQRQEIRAQNLHAEKNRLNTEQQEAAVMCLDSSIKRIPAFIKRLRGVTEQQRDALCRDIQALNFTRYISEVAAALTDAKLKMNDVWTSVQLCSLLHQRYPDFAACLYENWLKVLSKETLMENSSKFRVDLRLFAELITVHGLPINQATQHLISILKMLMNDDKEFSNLAILISFTRLCGEDYAETFSQKIRKQMSKFDESQPFDDIVTSNFHPAELKQQMRQMFVEYFERLSIFLVEEHKKLQKREQSMKQTMENRGEINQEIRDKFDQENAVFQKLLQNTETLADLLEKAMPELPIEEVSKKSTERIGIDFYLPVRSEEDLGGNSLWEDVETKQFYEDIPDLKPFLPSYAIREPPAATTTVAATPEEPEALDSAQMEQEIEKEALEVTTPVEGEEEDATLAAAEDPAEEDVGANNIKLMMDVFVGQLPTCVNREMIDKAARDFATNLNTKQNRKRLIKALFGVQRTYLHLLPFYSRLVAMLNPVMPEIGNELVRLLKNEFRGHIRRKDQIYIESKIKTVRFIGELVKFSVFPKTEAITCLKTLLGDFRHHNIEMCCNLLETCGRFLYRSPDCHRRTEIILEILMRKKAVLNLDNRYTTQIENAYYYCNPPESREIEKKVRSPIQEFLRRLLFKDLTKLTVEKVLRQVRKFNWADPEFRSYAIKCLSAPHCLKFNSIQCLASILSGLSQFYEDVVIEVLDNILDDIRSGLEINAPKFNQRRLCIIKYLGELYNYRIVDSLIIFRTFYLLITLGVSLDQAEISELDPPEHLFRIRLVCTLLDSCGQYFDRGTSKKRLDCFLNYFQRYYYFKKELNCWNPATYPFPLEIEQIFEESIYDLRPKFVKANTYTKAREIVENMEKEFINLINEKQAKFNEKNPSNPSRDINLAPITEDEEQFPDETVEEQGFVGQADEEDDDDDEEVDNDDDDEAPKKSRIRRSRMSGGSGPDDEYADTDDKKSQEVNRADDAENEVNGKTQERVNETISEEDQEFIKALEAMVAESVAQRSNDMTKIPAPDISIPVHLRKAKIPTTSILTNPSHSDGDDEGEKAQSMNFVVMLKKNNKPQFFDMAVSSTSEMALRFKACEQADREEKARLKILTLDMSNRIEQQENELDMIQSASNRAPSLPTSNFNREKRPKCVPPKGAPDADLIFGSKKR